METTKKKKGKLLDVLIGVACKCPFCSYKWLLKKKTQKDKSHECPKCRRRFEV